MYLYQVGGVKGTWLIVSRILVSTGLSFERNSKKGVQSVIRYSYGNYRVAKYHGPR